MKDEGKKISEIEKQQILYKLNAFLTGTDEFETLDGKTQVFDIAVKNLELELTRRIEHIRTVAETARYIATGMGLEYEEQLLAETIGNSHDIGHTPFGHNGERVLNKEVEKFGLGYTFKHEQYGANIFDEILERFLIYCKNFDIQIDKEYIQQIKEEIRVGILNHNQYYSYKVKNETMPQKCVRLADFIAFIISDLSDLLRYRTPTGKTLITRNTLQRIRIQLEQGIGRERLDSIMDNLESGNPSKLARLRSTIVDEIIDNKEKRGEIMTMRDDYKILKDMETSHNSNNIESLIQTIMDYFEYLTMFPEIAQRNDSFVQGITQIIGETEPQLVLQKLRNISKDDEEIISQLMTIVPKVYTEQLKRMIDEEIIDVPILTTLFIMQNIQYADILINNDEVLGNEQIDDKFREKFATIIKMAYFSERRDKKQGKKTLETYKGKKVPKFDDKRFKPLEYTVFAIQQMRNQDFNDDRVIELIMQELRITNEERQKIDEITMEDIYATARKEILEEQRRTRYNPSEIIGLEEVTLEGIAEIGGKTLNSATVEKTIGRGEGSNE